MTGNGLFWANHKPPYPLMGAGMRKGPPDRSGGPLRKAGEPALWSAT